MHSRPEGRPARGWALALALAAQAGAQEAPREVRFEARQEWALPGKPDGLCAADLDGDGHVELLAVTIAPGRVLSWKGTSRGLEREARSSACGDWPLPPIALASGAFGAPGASRRVAIASRGRRTLELFEPSPSGLVAAGAPLELPSVPRALATGDLGLDGVREIAVACDEGILGLVRETEPATVRRFALADELPRCARFLADGSGVLVGFQTSSSVQLLRCEDPRAGPALTLQLDGFPRALEEADLDGDGDLELAVAGGDHSLWIFGLGRPGGSSAWIDEQGRVPARWDTEAIPVALEAAAWGPHEGLILLQAYDLSVSVWSEWTAGDRPGPSSRRSSPAGQTPVALASGDFDADGHPDVAIANRDALAVSLLFGDGSGGLRSARSVPVGRFPNAIASCSLCGQQGSELVVIHSKEDALRVVQPQGGRFHVSPALPVGSEPRAVQCADLDGDGMLDVALLTTRGAASRLAVLFGRGECELASRPGADREVGPAATDLLLGDLTGDGLCEVVVADPQSGVVRVYVNRSSPGGAFALSDAFSTKVPSAPTALTPIQLDSDPLPELAVVLGSPGARIGLALLDAVEPSADGGALRELAFLPGSGAPVDVAAGDLDGDGHADLLVLAQLAPNSIEGFVQPWLRVPAEGSFRALAPLVCGHNARDLVAGDVNGDGRADFFAAAQNSHSVNGWISGGVAGAPAFARIDDLGAGRGCVDLALADLDGDGWLDLAVVNGFSEDLSLIFNRAR